MKLIEYINNVYEKDDNFFQKYKTKTKFKFILYFIITFIISGFAWYIVALFCSTYPNSTINLLICFGFNFIISFIIPFIFYGFVACFESNKSSNKAEKIINFLKYF